MAKPLIKANQNIKNHHTFSSSIPIIIINWNGLQDTLECIASVQKLFFPHFKIYLVDNHSSDESASILKACFESDASITLIFNQENLGFTRANNEVFKLILQEEELPPYIALLNNDTIVDPNWLTSLVKTAQQKEADIVSSKMIDYYERTKMDNAGHLMLNTGEILPIGHGADIEQYNNIFENMGACAGACLYSTSMLQEIGIFDEYFTTGYEDAELGARASIAGYKCIFEPAAIVYHKMGQSIKKVFNYQYAVDIQKKVLYTLLKLTPTSTLFFNLPFILLRYTVIILMQLVFWRPRYLEIIIQSIKGVLIDDYTKVKTARQSNSAHRKLSFLAINKKQTFFLCNNLKRFYHYFIQKKQSAFDAYGKKK